MPNDPYDLANAPARTGRRRRPMRQSCSLGVQAAGVTDHLDDGAPVRDGAEQASEDGAMGHRFRGPPSRYCDIAYSRSPMASLPF
jgi:hypothetical protein